MKIFKGRPFIKQLLQAMSITVIMTAATSVQADHSEWGQGTQYFTNDIVEYQGNYYIAEHDNPGYTPTVSTWYWEPVNVWLSGENYMTGDIVEYNDLFYIAKHDNPGYNPTISTWYWEPTDSGSNELACENPSPWQQANLTNYESYPDPGSEECIDYSGCEWAGQFAGLDGVQPENWVASHNIAAVHEKFFAQYNGKTLQLRQGDKWINAVVYDMCSDNDCEENCCTKNLGQEGFLIDIEKYTMERFGTGSGSVDFRICD